MVSLRHVLLASTALTSAGAFLIFLTSSVSANPTGGQAVAGAATIEAPNDKTLVVHQHSQNAVLEWENFDIDPGETTEFRQPNTDAWALNRVVGSQDPSVIAGTLRANGNLAIVNPDGIVFGQGSRIDVNSLIATTADIRNEDFMRGNLNFNLPGKANASIVNEGNISIGDHGLAAFVAPGVRNSGVILARFGTVSLASGNTFSLDLYGDGLVSLSIGDEVVEEVIDAATGQPMSDLVKNEGTISANGGTVALSAATARSAVNSVINNTGVIEANTVGMRNGKIVLGAQTAASRSAQAPRQKVRVGGRISASAVSTSVRPSARPGVGGKIEITGEDIEIAGATIDASGASGGGTILIGGDYLGGREIDEMFPLGEEIREEYDVATADTVILDNSSTITASATQEGDGGKIILWSDLATTTSAEILAFGAGDGTGGFIETSSAGTLRLPDSYVTAGVGGIWLLDPANINIGSDISIASINSSLDSGTDVNVFATDNISFLGNTIRKTNENSANLKLRAGGDINIGVAASGPLGTFFFLNGGDLTFSADGNVSISNTIVDTRSSSGTLDGNFSAVAGGNFLTSPGIAGTARAVRFDLGGGDFSVLSGGNVRIEQLLSSSHVGGTTDVINANDVSVRVTGDGFVDMSQAFVNPTGNVTLIGAEIDAVLRPQGKFGTLSVQISPGRNDNAGPLPVSDILLYQTNDNYFDQIQLRRWFYDIFDASLFIGNRRVNIRTEGLGTLGFDRANVIINRDGLDFSTGEASSDLSKFQFFLNGGDLEYDTSNPKFSAARELDFHLVGSINGSNNFDINSLPTTGAGQVIINGQVVGAATPPPTDNPPTPTTGTVTLTNAEQGTVYSATTAVLFADDNGVSGLTLSVSGLPVGLTATDNGDGTITISGTPLVSGPVTFSVTATDAGGNTASMNVSLTIDQPAPPPPIDNPPTVVGGNSINSNAGFKVNEVRIIAIKPQDDPGTFVSLGFGSDQREEFENTNVGFSALCEQTGTCWNSNVANIIPEFRNALSSSGAFSVSANSEIANKIESALNTAGYLSFIPDTVTFLSDPLLQQQIWKMTGGDPTRFSAYLTTSAGKQAAQKAVESHARLVKSGAALVISIFADLMIKYVETEIDPGFGKEWAAYKIAINSAEIAAIAPLDPRAAIIEASKWAVEDIDRTVSLTFALETQNSEMRAQVETMRRYVNLQAAAISERSGDMEPEEIQARSEAIAQTLDTMLALDRAIENNPGLQVSEFFVNDVFRPISSVFN